MECSEGHQVSPPATLYQKERNTTKDAVPPLLPSHKFPLGSFIEYYPEILFFCVRVVNLNSALKSLIVLMRQMKFSIHRNVNAF